MYLWLFFCNQAPRDLGGQHDQISLHLSHQVNRGLYRSEFETTKS